jgi:restriction endonuclease S subunit
MLILLKMSLKNINCIDVLFNRTNSYELVGKTGIFNLDGDYCFASYLVRLNFDRKKMTHGFLNYFMNSSIFQEKIKQKASRSINQANINATILSNENIQFPVSISEQQAIVRKLDALSSETQRLEAIYQQKLDNLAELTQAILQKAFAGELTAQPEQFLQEAVA